MFELENCSEVPISRNIIEITTCYALVGVVRRQTGSTPSPIQFIDTNCFPLSIYDIYNAQFSVGCRLLQSEAAWSGAAVVQEPQPLVRGAGDGDAERRGDGVRAGRRRRRRPAAAVPYTAHAQGCHRRRPG